MSRCILLLMLSLLLAGCGRNMYDQPKYKTYQSSSFFANGAASQGFVANTVPRTIAGSDNRYDEPSYYTGVGDEGFVSDMPVELTTELLQRGQQRYNIYCSPCHNYSGDGQGLITQRGFPNPTSFHDDRLRSVEVGYFVNAIANGFGRMYSYESRVMPEDRWAIAAYIKALQYSQHALPEDINIVPSLEAADAHAADHAEDAADHSETTSEGESH